MIRTFISYVFGCRVNEAEKVVMDKKLLELGFVWSDDAPDFYIINSCAVTGKAEREVRQHIYQTRKKFPHTKIVVTGCAATNWIKNNTTVKGVNLLIPNTQKSILPNTLQQLSIPSYQRVNTLIQYHDKFLASGRLMVKIQDGCNRFCSYCIVPFLRGSPKSKRIKDILKTIQKFQSDTKYVIRNTQHKNSGISEVILTAINTECFGKDTGETLIQLIDTVLKKTTIPFISFGSIHPWSITDEFLSYYQSIMPTGRFIPFFHIPIQSGSNKILKLMNRGYTKEEMLEKFQKIKKINPDAFIGTDIIVGFPGETEKEFKETYNFLKSAPIDKIHVFRYSERPGTPSEKFPNEPTPAEKQDRSHKLIHLGKLNREKHTHGYQYIPLS